MGEAQRRRAMDKVQIDPATAPRFKVQVQFLGKQLEFDRMIFVNTKEGFLIVADEFTTNVFQMSGVEMYSFTKI